MTVISQHDKDLLKNSDKYWKPLNALCACISSISARTTLWSQYAIKFIIHGRAVNEAYPHDYLGLYNPDFSCMFFTYGPTSVPISVYVDNRLCTECVLRVSNLDYENALLIAQCTQCEMYEMTQTVHNLIFCKMTWSGSHLVEYKIVWIFLITIIKSITTTVCNFSCRHQYLWS